MVSLRLIELFESVQGETSFSGQPTTFIRLAACNLRCSWCDTTYSFKRGQATTIADIISTVVHYGHPYVCITGGEPLLQPTVHPLMTSLCDLGFTLSLETSGSLTIEAVDPRVSVILDVKCPGSAMEGKNDWSNIAHLKKKDEVKFVLKDRADFDYAVAICRQYDLAKKVKEILFSPVFGVLDPQTLIQWILQEKFPARLNLQIHKWIWEPTTRGV